jgi:hypothetical protein
MSNHPQKAQSMQSEFSDALKQIQEFRQKVFAQIIATNNLKDFRDSQLTFPQLQILNPHQIIAE